MQEVFPEKKDKIEIAVARAQIFPIISRRESFSVRYLLCNASFYAISTRVDKHRDSNLANKQLVDARRRDERWQRENVYIM